MFSYISIICLLGIILKTYGNPILKDNNDTDIDNSDFQPRIVCAKNVVLTNENSLFELLNNDRGWFVPTRTKFIYGEQTWKNVVMQTLIMNNDTTHLQFVGEQNDGTCVSSEKGRIVSDAQSNRVSIHWPNQQGFLELIFIDETMMHFIICYSIDINKTDVCDFNRTEQFVIQNNQQDNEADPISWLKSHCTVINPNDFIVNNNSKKCAPVVIQQEVLSMNSFEQTVDEVNKTSIHTIVEENDASATLIPEVNSTTRTNRTNRLEVLEEYYNITYTNSTGDDKVEELKSVEIKEIVVLSANTSSKDDSYQTNENHSEQTEPVVTEAVTEDAPVFKIHRADVTEAEAEVSSENSEKATVLPEKPESIEVLPVKQEPTEVVQNETEKVAVVPDQTETTEAVPGKVETVAVLPGKVETIVAVPIKVDTISISPDKSEQLTTVSNKMESVNAVPDTSRSLASIREEVKPVSPVPDTPEPVVDESEISESVATEPNKSESVDNESNKPESVDNESDNSNTVSAEPEKLEPVPAEPETQEPSTAEPEKLESVTNELEESKPIADEPHESKSVTDESEKSKPVTEEPRESKLAADGSQELKPVTDESNESQPLVTIPDKIQSTSAAMDDLKTTKIMPNKNDSTVIVLDKSETVVVGNSETTTVLSNEPETVEILPNKTETTNILNGKSEIKEVVLHNFETTESISTELLAKNDSTPININVTHTTNDVSIHISPTNDNHVLNVSISNLPVKNSSILINQNDETSTTIMETTVELTTTEPTTSTIPIPADCPPLKDCPFDYCAFARKLDNRGCPTCNCLQSHKSNIVCPTLSCQACLYGHYTDPNGCPICQCQSRPYPLLGERCPHLNCNPCYFGTVKDEYNCDTCICIRPNSQECPLLNCTFGPCKHGSIKDEDNCPTCDCLSPPMNTTEVNCTSTASCPPCHLGYVRDADGCETCQCKLRGNVPCTSISSECHCEFGAYLNSDGCETCSCLPDPKNASRQACWELSNQANFHNMSGPACASDGSFYARQCDKTQSKCSCVTPTGIHISGFESKLEENVNCACAVELYQVSSLHMIGHHLLCLPNGNYAPIQCDGRYCSCVDENGKAIGPSVSVQNRDELRCVGVYQQLHPERFLLHRATIEQADNVRVPQGIFSSLCLTHLEQVRNANITDDHILIPVCDANGLYESVQCDQSERYCWCVDKKAGVEMEGTRRLNARPNCNMV